MEKRLAVVGNGASLRRNSYGKEIDSHDLVVRVNLYYRYMSSRETGLKTDVWSNRFSCNFAFPMSWDEQDVGEIWCIRPEDWDRHDIWSVPDWAYGRNLKFVEYPWDYYEELRRVGGTNPVTGTLTAIVAERDYPDYKIDLYGFDFSTDYYYEMKKEESEGITARLNARIHTPEIEAEVFEGWVNRKERVCWYK